MKKFILLLIPLLLALPARADDQDKRADADALLHCLQDLNLNTDLQLKPNSAKKAVIRALAYRKFQLEAVANKGAVNGYLDYENSGDRVHKVVGYAEADDKKIIATCNHVDSQDVKDAVAAYHYHDLATVYTMHVMNADKKPVQWGIGPFPAWGFIGTDSNGDTAYNAAP